MNERRGPWTVTGKRTVYDTPWMQITDHDVIRPDGAPGVYGVMSPKNWALAILPVHADGTVTLVGQHRFATDHYSWEVPEGGGPKDETPLDGARRELKEETGLTARSWQEIFRMDLSNSITDEHAYGFLAMDLTQGEAEPEGTEVLSLRRVPFMSALQAAMSGQIKDALTITILLRTYYMAREGELSPTIAQVLLGQD
ncbi:NUDIX domain-containing protein [Maricaulis sp. D1M11]|uniref:NUDIX domain-containing protein n=1 Tax=Maricaulis sp. D1M11 TaxID=3076117 RepID=UPI0039B433F3